MRTKIRPFADKNRFLPLDPSLKQLLKEKGQEEKLPKRKV